LKLTASEVHLWLILWSWENEVQETGSFMQGCPAKMVVCVTESEMALRKVGYEAWRRMGHVWALTNDGCCFKWYWNCGFSYRDVFYTQNTAVGVSDVTFLPADTASPFQSFFRIYSCLGSANKFVFIPSAH
jgi:hypothetical protein